MAHIVPQTEGRRSIGPSHGGATGGQRHSLSGAGGLDMSFGDTHQKFEKINLLGSGLSPHAISSLVLSVANITYLDLRGNRLDAAFGWRLVKAMKKRYLQLTFCNGVNVRAVRDNMIQDLNLSSITGHNGMYGMEAVGAIFLAHFLRLNTSLTSLCFRRNQVQKDGAKAIAQSMLGNPDCAISSVNNIGVVKPRKTGLDFTRFRAHRIATVHLSGTYLDDDDFVFLEEWMHHYDTVQDLDVSHNPFCKEGVRKLARLLRETKTLVVCKAVGLPVSLEGTATLVKAVGENTTLKQVSLPLGPCRHSAERQQVLQELGSIVNQHPKIELFGQANINLKDVRSFPEFSSLKPPFTQCPANEFASFLWFMANAKPAKLTTIHYGFVKTSSGVYPEVAPSPLPVWQALAAVVKSVKTISIVTLCLPPGFEGTIPVLRGLAECQNLRQLNLPGYASSKFRDPDALAQDGALSKVPTWLQEGRLQSKKGHWQAIHYIVKALPKLEQFNSVPLKKFASESPERITLLLLECVEGVGSTVKTDGQLTLSVKLSHNAEIELFADILRVWPTNKQLIFELDFIDKRVSHCMTQQGRFASSLTGDSVRPRYALPFVLKTRFTSPDILRSVDAVSHLREFGIDRIEQLLPSLFQAYATREGTTRLERIRISRKWVEARRIRKRFDATQRKQLKAVQSALGQANSFVEVQSTAMGRRDKKKIQAMSLEDFAFLMSGIALEDPPVQQWHLPQTHWEYFEGARDYYHPDPEKIPLFLQLPLDDESKESLRLRKVSLCNCGMRGFLRTVTRPDEWPSTSRPLWEGLRRLYVAGDWNEANVSERAEEDPNQYTEDPEFVRFHWRKGFRIGCGPAKRAGMLNHTTEDIVKPWYPKSLSGSRHMVQPGTIHSRIAAMADGVVLPPEPPPFESDLLHEILRTLLVDNPNLTSLDLRGNGLDKRDAMLLLSFLEQNETLAHLNMIPIIVDEAQRCTRLNMDGTCAPPEPDAGAAMDDDEEGHVYGRAVFNSNVVQLDEGDGFLFASLVTASNFPELREFSLRNHNVPDSALSYITDALLALPKIDTMRFSTLNLSARGVNLLLSAVVEMANQLIDLDGVNLARMLNAKPVAGASGPHVSKEIIEVRNKVAWNDFVVGALGKLQLWPATRWPAADAGYGHEGHLQQLRFEDRLTISDVALQGLCAMIHSGLNPMDLHAPFPCCPQLLHIDLTGNKLITDMAVADLCHALQAPVGPLKQGPRVLSVRACPKLQARSACELLQLLQIVRDASPKHAGNLLCGSLQMLNGVSIPALQAAAAAAGPASPRLGSGPGAAPQMLLATAAEIHSRQLSSTTEDRPRGCCVLPLSACDANFFANVLHVYPQIPHCHVHISMFRSQREGDAHWANLEKESSSVPLPMGKRPLVTNDKPAPTPEATEDAADGELLSRHLEAAKRFIETCPIHQKMKFSIAPVPPGCLDLLEQDDGTAVPPKKEELPPGIFAAVSGRLRQRAAMQGKHGAAADGTTGGEPTGVPPRPLYVNNINSQRMYDCIRTLYGVDDVTLKHEDVFPDSVSADRVCLPSAVDLTPVFALASSIDVQYCHMRPAHLLGVRKAAQQGELVMASLLHVNVNHNDLRDSGVTILFDALATAGASVQHVSAGANGLGDVGICALVERLPSLSRLSSIEFCDNFITETGSIALAEAIGGIGHAAPQGDQDGSIGPLRFLSVDLERNFSRELGALRWAEVARFHPTLQFLNLAENEIARGNAQAFGALVHATVNSPALCVLDLRNNFPGKRLTKAQIKKMKKAGRKIAAMVTVGPPSAETIAAVLENIPSTEFDTAEAHHGVFIRRHRTSPPDRKGTSASTPTTTAPSTARGM